MRKRRKWLLKVLHMRNFNKFDLQTILYSYYHNNIMYTRYGLYAMGAVYQTVMLYSLYSMVKDDYNKKKYNEALLKCIYNTNIYKK